MKTAAEEPIIVIDDWEEGVTSLAPVADVPRAGDGGQVALLADGGRRFVRAVVRKAGEEMGLSLAPAVMGTLNTSVVGITEIVLEALEESNEGGSSCDSGTADDEAAAFGIAEAVVRRGQGMSPTSFWRLMESYRLAYLELVRFTSDDVATRLHDEAVVEDCFDRMKRAGVEFSLRSDAEFERGESPAPVSAVPTVTQTARREQPSAASFAQREWGWPRVAARFVPRRRNPAGIV
jgi:hypothetical protein